VATDIVSVFLFGSSSSWWMFDGQHYVHLPASIVVCDVKQRTMMTSVNGAIGALSMGPSAGYNLILEFVKFNITFFAMIFMLLVFIFATSTGSTFTHMHIHVVANLLWYF
jgi:hypothetical protein